MRYNMGLIQRPQPQQTTAKSVATPVQAQKPVTQPQVAKPPAVAQKPVPQRSPLQQQAINKAGIARVMTQPQPVQAQSQFPSTPMEVEDLSQMANPLANITAQHSGGDFVSFPNDVFIDVGVIAYHIADLPPDSRYSSNDDPIPSVRFLVSDGETRKYTRWFRMSSGERSNMAKVFGTRIPNYQTYLEDDNLFSQGFQIRCIPSKDNAKYSDIELFQLGTADVSQLFYDMAYMPLQFTKAYGQIVPTKLVVLKSPEGIVRLRHDQLRDNNEYEAEKAMKRANGGVLPNVEEQEQGLPF